MKLYLKEMIDDVETSKARYFDVLIQLLVMLSVLLFCLETLPDLSENIKEALKIADITLLIIFTIEYLLRLYVSVPSYKYFLSFFGLIDLLAILPFYLALSIDLRSVRIFRLLRLIRVFKLVRYNKALRRLARALSKIKEELVLYFLLSSMIIFLAGVGIYFFEHEVQPKNFASVFHGLWWAVATLTTVGYGDIYPITIGGKIFTFLILMAGLGLVSVPSGLIAAALTDSKKE
ncbi:MAG: voltage-gated potassium channel [Candidatus Cloacimonadota bacterium]|nr:MAG: voltage-gated potassium channel [Candidatus Cloacimonadota bacterium]